MDMELVHYLSRDSVAEFFDFRGREGQIKGTIVYQKMKLDPAFPRPVDVNGVPRWVKSELQAYAAGLESRPRVPRQQAFKNTHGRRGKPKPEQATVTE